MICRNKWIRTISPPHNSSRPFSKDLFGQFLNTFKSEVNYVSDAHKTLFLGVNRLKFIHTTSAIMLWMAIKNHPPDMNTGFKKKTLNLRHPS